MPDATTTPSDRASPRHFPLALVVTAGLAGMLFAVTIVLWVHYGSAVFYEMLLTGIAACF